MSFFYNDNGTPNNKFHERETLKSRRDELAEQLELYNLRVQVAQMELKLQKIREAEAQSVQPGYTYTAPTVTLGGRDVQC